MKRIRNLSESDFLKLLFVFITGCFLIGAVCMPDRGTMFSGLWQIWSQPCKISTNYFAVGGYSATFLNMGMVAMLCTLLFVLLKATATNVSAQAFLLTVSFGSWGIHVLNILPTMLGVAAYALVKREKLSALVNQMLFSTGVAPLISELALRYPHEQTVGFRLTGLALALGVGFCIGFFLPPGLENSPKVHKGFDLYSAALPVGMMAFFLQAALYKTMGVALPDAPAVETLQVASQLTANLFYGAVFGLCVVFALVLGCRPRDYWVLLRDPELVTNFSSTYGNPVFLMNLGVFGLCILGYYNLIGASFNGVTFGIVLCMVACCDSGAHPGNVWPILLGYGAASLAFSGLSRLVGGTFTTAISSQAIVVGLCYATGLCPIADKFGWRYGFLAAVMHYVLVTSVPALHGGYCLYNGGFTAALICIILVPPLERFARTKQERQARKRKNPAAPL